MAGSGGVRFNFTAEANLVRDTKRTLRFVGEDEDGEPLVSLVGYEVEWHLERDLAEFDDLESLQTGALVSVLDGPIDTATAPNFDVPLARTDWPETKGRYAYELWRVDAGNEERLAYGDFPVIS